MIRGHANIQAIPNGLVSSADYFNANIFFTARNGDWNELLRTQRVDGKMVRAIKVSGRFTSLKNEEVLCETIDPEFPKKDIEHNFQLAENGEKPPPCK
jgi:hypothetical protein